MPDNRPPPRLATDLLTELSDVWLFAKGSEAILLVDDASGTVIAANPAAALFLRTARPRLLGARLVGLFRDEDATGIKRTQARAKAAGRDQLASAKTSEGSMDVELTISMARSGQAEYQLVRLQRAGSSEPDSRVASAFQSVVFETLEAAKESFVVTDLAFRIEYANPAFHSLVGLARGGEAVGQSLLDWLNLGTADRDRLARQMAHREAVETLVVGIETASGTVPREVRVVSVPDGDWPCWAFLIQGEAERSLPHSGSSGSRRSFLGATS